MRQLTKIDKIAAWVAGAVLIGALTFELRGVIWWVYG